MANEKLTLVIDALNKASDDIKKIKDDIGGLEDATKKADKSNKDFGSSWAGVMTGLNMGIQVVQQVWQGMKQVYEAAREGAELEMLGTRFDNLTASIGTTADALMIRLREATSGMMSDAELMQSATDFMSLGLANSADEVVRLSNVAGQLGMDMNQLVLTLTNQTTMRFDALGVSVDGFDEKVQKLKESGMDANEAFTEAFLQQAEEQIERVGSAADTSMGDFMRMEAAFENMSNTFKLQAAQVIGPVIEMLADGFAQVAQSQDLLTEAQMQGAVTAEEYKDVMRLVNAGYMDAEDAAALLEERTEGLGAAMDTTAEDMIEASIQTALYGDAVEEVADKTMTADDAMRKYTETLLFKMASEGLDEEQALDLAIAMGLVDENTMYAQTQVDLLRQRYDEGIITAEQYEAAILALGEAIEGIESKEVMIKVNIGGSGVSLLSGIADIKTGNVGDTITGTSEAVGGTVSAGNPYLWQEYGYRGETLVPSQNGYVLSRADAKRILSEAGGGQAVYSGPSADDIARAVRDAMLTAGVI